MVEIEERFARVAIGNTGLPARSNTDSPMSPGFMNWKATYQRMIDAGDIPNDMTLANNTGDPSVQVAFDAPFYGLRADALVANCFAVGRTTDTRIFSRLRDRFIN